MPVVEKLLYGDTNKRRVDFVKARERTTGRQTRSLRQPPLPPPTAGAAD